MTGNHETRLKRLRMRSWRRGIREMDLILGPFADDRASQLEVSQLDCFEEMLEENDHDLYSWISGAEVVPVRHQDLVAKIRDYHRISSTTAGPGMT